MLKKAAEKTVPIHMMPIATLLLAAERPKGVDLVIRDSSSGSPLTDAELKASIYNHGVIQPLIFRAIDGKRYVVAGNRRLRFLREIFGAESEVLVQTQNVDDFEGDWREIAMDTNLSLPPHLVERYEIIVALVKDLKLSPEDARLRYGMTPRQFAQVMALGKMSPLIREKWKAGTIDAKTAQAFTLEPDPKEQDKIYAAAAKRGHNGSVDAWFVKERIIPAAQRDTGKLVNFVGMDVCKKAKIIKQEDLFSDSHIVTDVKALTKLADEKLFLACSELTSAGWSWAAIKAKVSDNVWHYGSVTPAGKLLPTAAEKARLAEIKQLLESDQTDIEYNDDMLIEEQEKIDQAIKERAYTPAQRAKAGCFLEVNSDGTISIEYGKVKPAEKKKVAASERPKKTKAKNAKPGEALMSQALTQRVTEQLEKAGAELLKKHHDVAVSALIAGFASGGDVISVSIGGRSEGREKTSSFSDVFLAALKSTQEQRAAMLAQIAAQALDIVSFNPEGLPLDKESITELFDAMKGANDEIFKQFDIKDYFASVSGDVTIEAVRCTMGNEHADKVAKMDKSGKAKFASTNLKDKNWLPKPLRTSWYTGSVEGGDKPAKKSTAKKATKKKRK